jgi:hypothetical protein
MLAEVLSSESIGLIGQIGSREFKTIALIGSRSPYSCLQVFQECVHHFALPNLQKM